jgi:hypothetical protein
MTIMTVGPRYRMKKIMIMIGDDVKKLNLADVGSFPIFSPFFSPKDRR